MFEYCCVIYIISILLLLIANWVLVNNAFNEACKVKWLNHEPKEFNDTADLTKSCAVAVAQDIAFMAEIEAKWPSYEEA